MKVEKMVADDVNIRSCDAKCSVSYLDIHIESNDHLRSAIAVC